MKTIGIGGMQTIGLAAAGAGSKKYIENKVVSTLPTASEETINKIYFVPSEDSDEGNVMDEYITIATEDNGVVTYAWEKIGGTQVDISGKLVAPLSDGNIGQVLQIGSNGKPEWVTPSAGTTPDSEMSDSSTNAPQNKVVKAYVDENYVKTHGKYKGLTSGLAENLEGSEINVTAGYTERFTAVDGSNDNEVADGLVKMTEIQGRACAWNQIVQKLSPTTYSVKGIDVTIESDGKITLSGTTTDEIRGADINISNEITITNGHTYLLSCVGKGNCSVVRLAGNLYGTRFNGSVLRLINDAGIATAVKSGSERFCVVIESGTTVNVSFYFMLLDLTLLNPNLAAKVDLTVAEVEAYLASINRVKPYYAFNAGTLLGARMKGWSMLSTPNLLNPTTKSARLIEYNYAGHDNEYTIKNLPDDAKIKFVEDKVGDNLPVVTNLVSIPDVATENITKISSNSLYVNGNIPSNRYVSMGNISLVEGHKYCFLEQIASSFGKSYCYITDRVLGDSDRIGNKILTCTQTITSSLTLFVQANIYSNVNYSLIAVDLTATFGEGNEPATVADAERMLFGVIPVTDDHFTIPSTGTASIVNASDNQPYSGEGNLATSWLIATLDGSKDDMENIKPYEESNADIDSANIYWDNNGTMTQVFEGGVMRSTGDGDSNVCDELWFDKVDKKWKAEVNVGEQDLGAQNMTWNKSGNTAGFYSAALVSVCKIPDDDNEVNVICEQYNAIAENQIPSVSADSKSIAISTEGSLLVTSPLTDASAFKSSMSGIKLWFTLATPIIHDTLYYKVGNDYLPMEEVFQEGINNFDCNWATEALAQEAEVDGQPQSITPVVTEVFNEDLKEALKSLIDEHENNVNLGILKANLVALCTCINTKLDVSISVSETPNESGVFTFS